MGHLCADWTGTPQTAPLYRSESLLVDRPSDRRRWVARRRSRTKKKRSTACLRLETKVVRDRCTAAVTAVTVYVLATPVYNQSGAGVRQTHRRLKMDDMKCSRKVSERCWTWFGVHRFVSYRWGVVLIYRVTQPARHGVATTPSPQKPKAALQPAMTAFAPSKAGSNSGNKSGDGPDSPPGRTIV